MPRYVFKKRVVPAVLQKATLNFPDNTLEITVVGFVWNHTTLMKKTPQGVNISEQMLWSAPQEAYLPETNLGPCKTVMMELFIKKVQRI